MKTYQTLVIDDDPIDTKLVLHYVNQIPFLTVAGTFDNALAALSFLNTQPVDLLVMDIYMPQLTGLQLLKSLPKSPVVILTTNSLTDSLEAYDLGVVDYLVKPFGFERFLRAVNRAFPRMADDEPVQSEATTVYLKEGRTSVLVLLKDIWRVEAFGGFCRVFLGDKMLFVSHSITEMAEMLLTLPTRRFVRTHRSHIVGIDKIARYETKELYIGEQRIPIGEGYRASVQTVLLSENTSVR